MASSSSTRRMVEESGIGAMRAATPRGVIACARRTIAPRMEPARLGTASRRPRRGSVERPIDTRLVRKVSLVLVAPLLLAVLTLNRSGPLPPPTLPPSFDTAAAVALTTELASLQPDRVPGSPEAADAASWYREKLALYGLAVARGHVGGGRPGRRPRRARNLVAVVPGTLDETIVVVAHRDNNGRRPARTTTRAAPPALVELARPYATVGTTESARTPLHTLVFLSTDGGAYGALGAERFAAGSPLARRAVAVVSLDGLAGDARPRLELSGSTATRRRRRSSRPRRAHRERDGQRARRPAALTQLVSLALPFGYGEQSPFLSAGAPAIRITTASDAGTSTGQRRARGPRPPPAGTAREGLRGAAQLPRRRGRGPGLDRRRRVPRRPRRARLGAPASPARGRPAVRRGDARPPLALPAPTTAARRRVAGAPRARRRLARAPRPARPRGRRRRASDRAALPPPPDQPPGRLVAVRRRGAPPRRGGARMAPRAKAARAARPGDARGGARGLRRRVRRAAHRVRHHVLVSPYGLVFVLPSLYAWLWLPQLRRASGWATDASSGSAVGPALALVVLAEQLDLGSGRRCTPRRSRPRDSSRGRRRSPSRVGRDRCPRGRDHRGPLALSVRRRSPRSSAPAAAPSPGSIARPQSGR